MPAGLNDERSLLDGWLDYYRATLLAKCEGLTGEQRPGHATAASEAVPLPAEAVPATASACQPGVTLPGVAYERPEPGSHYLVMESRA
jgi:hypothetical protein